MWVLILLVLARTFKKSSLFFSKKFFTAKYTPFSYQGSKKKAHLFQGKQNVSANLTFLNKIKTYALSMSSRTFHIFIITVYLITPYQ